MSIYAAMGIPEVWRLTENSLEFFVLGESSKYGIVESSPTFSFPILPPDLRQFVVMREKLDDNEVIRQFREWIRARIASTPKP